MIIPICALVGSGIVTWIYHKYVNPKRIYCNDEGWQPIETIPKDEWPEIKILLSDGEEIYEEIRRQYNKDGKICFGSRHDESVATHWRKMPMPPMTERKHE